MKATPNWCKDYDKLTALLDAAYGLQGFHPKMGHCIISNNYGFTQDPGPKCSVLAYGKVKEFEDSASASIWCELEKVWFIDPYNAYNLIDED